MPRKRLIAPEFFRNSALYQAERATGLPLRVAYPGLWCYADRAGRFKWQPEELGSVILPYDKVDFSAVLDALAAAGFIVRYVIDGKEYGAIPTFADWQHPHVKEGASTLPAPVKHRASTVLAPVEHGASTGNSGTSTPVAVTVAVAVTDTVTVAVNNELPPNAQPPRSADSDMRDHPATTPATEARPASPAARRVRPPAKYPHFSDDARRRLLEAWTRHVGPVAIGELYGAFGPAFGPEPRFTLDEMDKAIEYAKVEAACLDAKRSSTVERANLTPRKVARRWNEHLTRARHGLTGEFGRLVETWYGRSAP